jgi:hypothetical protein
MHSYMHAYIHTFLAGGVDPGQVAVDGVCGGCNELSTHSFELLAAVIECNNLSRAHKGEVLHRNSSS